MAPIDFSYTSILIDKIRFYLLIDFNKEDDIELVNEIIQEIKIKNI